MLRRYRRCYRRSETLDRKVIVRRGSLQYRTFAIRWLAVLGAWLWCIVRSTKLVLLGVGLGCGTELDATTYSWLLELPICETPYRCSSLIDWTPYRSSYLAAAARVRRSALSIAAAGCIGRAIRVEYCSSSRQAICCTYMTMTMTTLLHRCFL